VAADATAPGSPAATSRAWLWGTAGVRAATIAVVAALAPPASAPPDQALAWLLFTGSSVHVAATGWLYTLPAVRAHAARRMRDPFPRQFLTSHLPYLVPPRAGRTPVPPRAGTAGAPVVRLPIDRAPE
jgi:hypothetical protein